MRRDNHRATAPSFHHQRGTRSYANTFWSGSSSASKPSPKVTERAAGGPTTGCSSSAANKRSIASFARVKLRRYLCGRFKLVTSVRDNGYVTHQQFCTRHADLWCCQQRSVAGAVHAPDGGRVLANDKHHNIVLVWCHVDFVDVCGQSHGVRNGGGRCEQNAPNEVQFAMSAICLLNLINSWDYTAA